MSVDVKNIVVNDIITVKKERTVASAKSLMTYFKLDALIVTDDDEPVGFLTFSDIQQRCTDKKLDPHVTLVGEIHTEPLIWVRYNTTLTEVGEIMREEQINHLPIFGNLSNGPILLGLYVNDDREIVVES